MTLLKNIMKHVSLFLKATDSDNRVGVKVYPNESLFNALLSYFYISIFLLSAFLLMALIDVGFDRGVAFLLTFIASGVIYGILMGCLISKMMARQITQNQYLFARRVYNVLGMPLPHQHMSRSELAPYVIRLEDYIRSRAKNIEQSDFDRFVIEKG